jgi:uracil-DNA glycosylase family 4
MDLTDLYEEYREDPAFDHLRTEHIRLVPGRGTKSPRVLIVGQNPGATENLQLKPFVGKAGKLLSQLMALAGLFAEDRFEVPSNVTQSVSEEVRIHANTFITNAVKYKTPRNRVPSPEEIAASRGYLRREWKLLGRPPVIVATGGVALNSLRPDLTSIGQLAGKVVRLTRARNASDTCYMVAMYHPMFGIYNESNRPQMEEHWEELGEWLRSNGVL